MCPVIGNTAFKRAGNGGATICILPNTTVVDHLNKLEAATGPWEEVIFFDHPSGHTRVRTAMRWKAEHLAEKSSPAPQPDGSGLSAQRQP